MADYVPLLVSVLVAGATVATVAILLRTPIRLTDARCRLAELEARVVSAEASAKKALRQARAERKAEKAEQEAEAEDGFLPFPVAPSAPAATNHRDPLSLDAVKRAIRARRGG